MVQLQDLVSELRPCKDPDVKNEIKTAKHCIQDADKLKQVWKPPHLNSQQFMSRYQRVLQCAFGRRPPNNKHFNH